jgi:hypothetical protein
MARCDHAFGLWLEQENGSFRCVCGLAIRRTRVAQLLADARADGVKEEREALYCLTADHLEEWEHIEGGEQALRGLLVAMTARRRAAEFPAAPEVKP